MAIESSVAQTSDFTDLTENLTVVRDDLDEMSMCVGEAADAVEDTRDALGVFRSVQQKSAAIEKLLDGLEKAAGLAKKVGPISNAAKTLEIVFDKVGESVGKIEKASDKVADKVQPVRDNLKKLEKKLEDAEKKLDKAADAVDKTHDQTVEVDQTLIRMQQSTLSAAAAAADDLKDCLDQASLPANEAMFEFDTRYLQAREYIDPVKDLFDSVPVLGDIDDIIAMESVLGKILDSIKFLEKPLEILEAALDEVSWALDAAESVYNNVVAPVIDPVIEATGINDLIDAAASKLEALLPNPDLIDAFDGIAADIEAVIPGVTTPNINQDALFDDFFDGPDGISGLNGMLGALDQPGVAQGVDVGSPTTPELGAGEFNVGLPFDFQGLGIQEIKANVWKTLSDAADTVTIGDDDNVLLGAGGGDVLRAKADNNKVDILVGGKGGDSFSRVAGNGDADPYDIFIGGRGDDVHNAEGNVVVSFASFISDYNFDVNIDNTKIVVEHLNLTGGLDEGTDTIHYDADTVLSFDGYTIDAVTFAAGYQESGENGVGRDITGDGEPDFLFGDDRNNQLRGRGDDDVLVGRDGDDLLNGFNGDDYLDGGNGSDTINGGDGDDVADFRSITDFSGLPGAGDVVKIFGFDISLTEASLTGIELFLDEVDATRLPDTVQKVERVIATDNRDILFGSRTNDEILLGGGADDILRSSGGGGSRLIGEDGRDVIVMDTGQDTAEGGMGRDLFFGVLDPTENGKGNQIDGGDGVTNALEFDILSYANHAVDGSDLIEGSGSLNAVYDQILFKNSIDAQLAFEDRNAAGRVIVDIADGKVSRFASDDAAAQSNGIDTFVNIEALFGSINGDLFLADGPSGALGHVHGDDGDDVFQTTTVAADADARFETDDKPKLYGDDGDDLFLLQDIYDVNGGAGVDTLDLSSHLGLSWYLESNQEDDGDFIGLNVFLASETLPDPLQFAGDEDFAAEIDGIEIIIGGANRDVLIGDSKVTHLHGGDGDDYLATKPTTDQDTTRLFGEAGDDTLVGGDRKDIIDGGDGNDVIDLTLGVQQGFADKAFGGLGNDIFFVTSSHGLRVFGGGEENGTLVDDEYTDDLGVTRNFSDLIDFSNGVDGNQQRAVVDLRNNANNGAAAANHEYFGIENVAGGNNDDDITGGDGANFLFGRRGDDELHGKDGDDVLVGGLGADDLFGGNGDDVIFGGTSPEGLKAKPNLDVFEQQAIAPELSSRVVEEVFGGDGIDTLSFATVRPRPLQTDPIPPVGEVGSVEVDIELGEAIFTEELAREVAPSGTVDVGPLGFQTSRNISSLAEFHDTVKTIFQDIENVAGGAQADIIKGDSADNLLFGDGGNDELAGRGGDDVLIGGRGADDVFGNSGDDRIFGGPGNDDIDGGDGFDTLDYGGLVHGVSIDIAAGVVDGAVDDIAYAWADNDGTESRAADDKTVAPVNVFRIENPGYTKLAKEIDSRVRDAVLNGDGEVRNGFEITATDVVDTFQDSFADIERFEGGAGDDVFNASGAGTFELDGGAGAGDTVVSTLDGVTIDLRETGAQVVVAGALTLTLANIENATGGAGDDVLHGDAGDNVLEGAAGDDVLDGHGGVDAASYAGATAAVTVSLATPGSQDTGGAGVDTLSNIEGLIGSGHGDTLTGDAGDNLLDGRAGNDVLIGAAGADALFGRAGADDLQGGDGDDVIEGGTGGDDINGGAGSDTAAYRTAALGVTVSLAATGAQSTGAGQDVLTGIENLVGSDFDDALTGDATGNSLAGGLGDDTLDGAAGADVLDGGEGDDVIAGGDGQDTILGGAGADDLDGGADADDLNGDDGDDLIEGGGGADNIAGGSGDDTLRGGAGEDDIAGGDGDDDIQGDFDDDALNGGAGDDLLHGGSGADVLDGGAGNDELVGGDGADVARGGAGDDLIVGGIGDDDLQGDDGDDELQGDAGDDVVRGGAGNDAVSYAAAATGVVVSLAIIGAQDTVGAGLDDIDGVENLIGSDFDDSLTGDGGDNRMTGGRGVDSIDGGAGEDTAVFTGDMADYAMIANDDGSLTVMDRRDGDDTDGIDRLTNIEVLRFADVTIETGGVQTVDAVGEWGRVDLALTASTGFTTIDLQNSYENAVVIASVVTANDADIVTTRIQNVGSDSFQIMLAETSDLDGVRSGTETVSYLVVEAGRHSLQDGVEIEAGVIATDRVFQSTLVETPDAIVAFDERMANVRLFATANTANGGDWFTARVTESDADGFTVALQEEEASTGGHGAEDIGWLAVASGPSAEFASRRFRTDDAGTDRNGDIDLASLMEADGIDPAVVRVDQSGGLIVSVQEDVSADAETSHTDERIATLDFDQDFGFLVVSNIVAANDIDQISTDEDVVLYVDVLANDIDPDGGVLTLISVTQPEHGSAVIDDGLVRYTPDPDFNGFDQLSYSVTDSRGETQTADVFIAVNEVNDLPIPGFASFEVDENAVLRGVLPLELWDADFVSGSDALVITEFAPASAAHGAFTVRKDGGFIYTPAGRFDFLSEGEVFQDVFELTVRDTSGAIAPVEITFEIQGKDDPVAVAGLGGRQAGGVGADALQGDAEHNRFYGLDGDDYLNGGAGRDWLYGGDGDDDLVGGDDDGAGGGDVIRGGDGDDAVLGSAAFDRVYGGDGDDVANVGGGADVVLGGAGADVAYGEAGRDRLFGGSGDDELYGEAGADKLFGNAGDDALWGGDGGDVIRGALGDDVIHGEGQRDRLFGGKGDDELFGGGARDSVFGEAGDDFIDGGEGPDLLVGGVGDDLILGGAGNDKIVGGEGRDVLTGGGGRDKFYIAAGDLGEADPDDGFDYSGLATDIVGVGEVITDFQTGFDRLRLIQGLRVDYAETADINRDGVVDSVVFMRGGEGALALLGIDDFDEVAL